MKYERPANPFSMVMEEGMSRDDHMMMLGRHYGFEKGVDAVEKADRKETGIIMSGDHPRLVMAGLKTMTRRVIKPQPELKERGWGWAKGETTLRHWPIIDEFSHALSKFCPYGQVGDRLWVREIYSTHPTHYKADGYTLQDGEGLWHPSIFMRKVDARIWLEITGLRVERVQEISEADCYAEGVESAMVTDKNGKVLERITSPAHADYRPTVGRSLVKAYFAADVWDSLNAERGYGWDNNPWVWVVSFKLLTER